MLDIESSALIDLLKSERAAGNPTLNIFLSISKCIFSFFGSNRMQESVRISVIITSTADIPCAIIVA